MPNAVTITSEEYEALQAALRVVTAERDLLKEQLKAFQCKLFAAKSEARGSGQKDLFFNEAEALASGQGGGPHAQAARTQTAGSRAAAG